MFVFLLVVCACCFAPVQSEEDCFLSARRRQKSPPFVSKHRGGGLRMKNSKRFKTISVTRVSVSIFVAFCRTRSQRSSLVAEHLFFFFSRAIKKQDLNLLLDIY